LADPDSLLLASRSPHRRAFLELLGIPFDVVEPVFE
jgi:predicted house-cleaning NTP pyrophosphatase (Maf/HAM1 superfamily)